MKTILLATLLTVSTLTNAEEIITLDDLPLPKNIDKVQWLKENTAIPFNPNTVYSDPTYIHEPFKPSKPNTNKVVHCDYGMGILGGCKTRKDYKVSQHHHKLKQISEHEKQIIINRMNKLMIVKPVAELKKIFNRFFS